MDKLKKVLVAGAVVMAAALSGAGNVQAALMQGHVDPPISGTGTAADGTYWTSLISFDTDFNCLQNGFNDLNGPPFTCSSPPLFPSYSNLSITATLSDGSTTIPITFSSGGTPQINVYLSGGTAIGISAPYPTGQFGNSSFFLSSAVQGNAWLEYAFDTGPFTGLSTGTLFLEICGGPGEPTCTGLISNAIRSSGRVQVSVTDFFVPEPSIAWLLLAAFPVLWLARRRSQPS